MKRISAMAALAALILGVLFVPAGADRSERSSQPQVMQESIPAPDSLKIQEGTLEGHKRPLEVVKRAIEAAKEDDLAGLKECFKEDVRKQLDQKSWDWPRDQGEKNNLQHIAHVLKEYDTESLTELEQNSTGTYAVVMARKGEGVHAVRARFWKPFGDKEAVKNWFLTDTRPVNYLMDFNTGDVKAIREAITSGDVQKMKEFLQDYQTYTLDLLTGADEGVDGYNLLLKRLQKIVNVSDKPRVLINASSTSMAYWFHGDDEDAFLVVQMDYGNKNWESKTKTTNLHIDIDSTARFHRDGIDQFSAFVSDYDW